MTARLAAEAAALGDFSACTEDTSMRASQRAGPVCYQKGSQRTFEAEWSTDLVGPRGKITFVSAPWRGARRNKRRPLG